MNNENKVTYIKFFAPVIPQTANVLMNVVDDKVRQGYQKIVLLISTPGGSVHHGISIYNYLKGLSIEIETHNFGSVDSIGAVIYCAGKKRYSVKNARFLIHPIQMQFSQNQNLEEKQLEEKLNSLKVDETNISAIIAQETGKEKNDVLEAIQSRTTLLPNDAKTFGLVHEIKDELIPSKADLSSVNMS